MPDNQNFVIQTFTMASDFVEDRIRLHAVNAEGEFLGIFLTRRLCDRFLPMLVKNAETKVRQDIPRDLLLTMNQERLKVEREENPTPAVEPPKDLKLALCHTIHFKERPDGLLLTFTDGASFSAHIVLNETAVRAVLDVFLTTYRTLEWADEVFPEWVRLPNQPAPIAPSALN